MINVSEWQDLIGKTVKVTALSGKNFEAEFVGLAQDEHCDYYALVRQNNSVVLSGFHPSRIARLSVTS